jgi:hypothetical protein
MMFLATELDDYATLAGSLVFDPELRPKGEPVNRADDSGS